MDIAPIYELQARLRAAAIAGVNLLPEDFRLRRAAEAVKPLGSASPVFAKLNQQMASLLAADCENPVSALLDALSLADAVVCTLGAVDAAGEISDVEMGAASGSGSANFPYSQVHRLIEALTTSGSGNYTYVHDLHQINPEIFRDYRVRYAMVLALGASYAYLADLARMWLKTEDASILPLLKKDFDPKGKREMRFRLEVIATIAGNRENDFYRKIFPDAGKEIRTELIRILGADPANMEFLLELAQTEKGRNKQLALDALAGMQDDRIDEVFEKMAVKKPEEVCEHLVISTTEGASRLISRMCLELLPEILEMQEGVERSEDETKKIKRFCRCVEALVGKSGEDVIRCYRLLLDNKEKLGSLAGEEIDYLVVDSLPNRYREDKHTWEETIARHLADSLAVHEDGQLAQLVMEQYEKSDAFLTAAALVKLYEGDDCTQWFEEQLRDDADARRFDAIEAALRYVVWDERIHAYTMYGAVHTLHYISVSGEDTNRYLKRVVNLPNSNLVMDWMVRNCREIVFYFWIDRDNEAECARMGEWFYNHFFEIDGPAPNARVKMIQYVDYMDRCRWKKCTGLAEYFAMHGQPFLDSYQIEQFFKMLPGPRAEARAEMDVFIRLLEENKVEGITELGVAHYKYLRDQIFEGSESFFFAEEH